MFNFGSCYFYGNGVEQDYKQAVYWLRKAAELGDAEAQNRLGYCYDNGNGVVRNVETAIRWFMKAADQGQAKAEYNLGLHYYKGNGVEKDERKAVNLVQNAYFHGFEYAKDWLDKRTEEGWYRNCPYCKYHADLTATTCPHCGADL